MEIPTIIFENAHRRLFNGNLHEVVEWWQSPCKYLDDNCPQDIYDNDAKNEQVILDIIDIMESHGNYINNE